jgi:omega-amidase
MHVVAVQFHVRWEDKAANFARVRELLKGSEVPSGSLIVLPEMFSTGFSLNTGFTRQGTPPEGEQFLTELAREFDSAVMGGVVGGEGDKPTNQSVTVDPSGRVLARYAKIHPFSFGDETKHYSAGREIVTFEWGGFTIAPFVCYDLRFPEIFRAAVDRGATLFAIVAQWPIRRAMHWSVLLQARAIENQTCVVGVNRTGNDPTLVYPGCSAVLDAQGTKLTEGDDQERVLHADLDPAAVAKWRADFPALRDRHWGLSAEGR